RSLLLNSKPARIAGPWLCIGLRIIECDGEFHVIAIDAMPSLGREHVFTERHSPLITPKSWVEAGRLDDKSIPIPSADGISVESRTRILRHLAIVGPNLAPDPGPFEKLHGFVSGLNKLERSCIHERAK